MNLSNKEKQFQIYLKGEDKTDRIQEFELRGNKCVITFKNGKEFIYNASNVNIIESVLNHSKSCDSFEFLKSIADRVGLKTKREEGGEINILSRNYSQIGFISPDSLLGAFLSGKLSGGTKESVDETHKVIYPFGFNVSQKNAVDKALSHKLSMIEGPPGTGKTQTILNIIANLVMRGESVAIVSSNNSATKNVLEKLQKNDVDFIAAYLGNTDNKKDFIDTQKPRPSLKSWCLAPEITTRLNEELGEKHKNLETKLSQQLELSRLRNDLSGIEVEQKHFQKYAEDFDQNRKVDLTIKIKSSSEALDMWILCEKYQSSNKLVAFIKYVFEMITRGKSQQLFLHDLIKQYHQGILVAEFQRRFYQLKVSELGKAIANIKRELDDFDFKSKMNEYREASLQLFKASLADRYNEKKVKNYKLDDLWRRPKEFINDYPVILSTTYSLRSSLSQNISYDYVIIDESSQVDLCTGALALSCAKNAVVVGDLKQLPHVVDRETARMTDSIFSKYDLPEAYRYKNQSLLSSLISIFPEVPKTLLREHYRCHPKIIEFCNKKFYDSQLIALTEGKWEREPLVVYKTVEGNHARNRVNQRQIDMIKKEIIPQQELNLRDHSLGIVTPYRNQTNALKKAFDEESVKADTVDKFQGQENKIIILSTVDNEVSGFTDNANRLNVAVSRAIEQLIVIVNAGDALEDKNIGDLIRYIEYNNLTVVKSKVHSVFDYLYLDYAKRREEFLKGKKRISEYDSENLMYNLISDVLKERESSDLKVVAHIPIKMIIRDVSLLDKKEEKYAMHPLTHVDFLIFDTLGKIPKVAIEVDGVAFHQEGSRQSERDGMKDEILKKYDIPLFRFRTDESGERERLHKILDNL